MDVMLIGIAILTVIVVIWAITTTNRFKHLEIKITEALSGIEVALEKRYDMLNKLLDIAKAYLEHEKTTFEKVVMLRKGMSVDMLSKADQDIDDMTSGILAVAENYPELRSSEVFVELETGVKDAEEHLQAARRVYNANVSAYNSSIAMFPSSLLKGSRVPKAFYQIEDHKHQDVKMKF